MNALNKDNMKPMEVNVYNTIEASKDAYRDPVDAIVDELTQNFFDHTFAFRATLEEASKRESDGPQAIMIIDFSSRENNPEFQVSIEQDGSTGILNREAYTTFSEKTKLDPRERGSRGQGWKTTVLPFSTIVRTETQVSASLREYYQSIVKADHINRKISVSKVWFTPDNAVFPRTRFKQGTTIHIAGFDEEFLDELEKRAGLIIIQRWWSVIKRCSNYKIIIKHKDDDPEIISADTLPILPPMMEGIDPIKEKDHRFESSKRPRRIDALRNLEIYHSFRSLPRGIREGIALICNGHTIDWYKSELAAGLDGYIYGFVEADYLKKSENTTHQGLKDDTRVRSTRKELDKFLIPLVEQIRDQELGSIMIESSGNLMAEINDLLDNLLPEPIQRGTGARKRKQMDSDAALRIVNFTVNNRQPKSGQVPTFKISFKHLKEGKKKLSAVIRFVSNEDNSILHHNREEFTLTGQDSNGEFLEAEVKQIRTKIPEVFPFYSRDVTVECYILPSGDFKVDGSPRKLRIRINPIIISLKTDASDYRRSDTVFPTVEITKADKNHIETYFVRFRVLKGREEEFVQSSPLPSIILDPESATTLSLSRSQSWTIPKDAERRRYRLLCEMIHPETNRVVEGKYVDFEVENFILSLKAPKDHIRSDKEPLRVSVQIINPLKTKFKGRAVFKAEGPIGNCGSVVREIELDPNQTWEDQAIPLIIGLKEAKGNYSIICDLFDDHNYRVDLELVRVRVEQTETGGILSDIDYSRLPEEKLPAYIGNDGKVRINVLHPLFDRMGDIENLTKAKFLSNLFIILYYALADANRIDEDMKWWDFEFAANNFFKR